MNSRRIIPRTRRLLSAQSRRVSASAHETCLKGLVIEATIVWLIGHQRQRASSPARSRTSRCAIAVAGVATPGELRSSAGGAAVVRARSLPEPRRRASGRRSARPKTRAVDSVRSRGLRTASGRCPRAHDPAGCEQRQAGVHARTIPLAENRPAPTPARARSSRLRTASGQRRRGGSRGGLVRARGPARGPSARAWRARARAVRSPGTARGRRRRRPRS